MVACGYDAAGESVAVALRRPFRWCCLSVPGGDTTETGAGPVYQLLQRVPILDHFGVESICVVAALHDPSPFPLLTGIGVGRRAVVGGEAINAQNDTAATWLETALPSVNVADQGSGASELTLE